MRALLFTNTHQNAYDACMNQRTFGLGVGFFTIIGGISLAYLLAQQSSAPKVELSEHHEDTTRGIALAYPSSLVPQILSAADAQEVSIELHRDDPSLQITVWEETGLAALESLAGTPLLSQLRRNVDRRFTSAYPEIEKEGIQDTSLGSQDAFVVHLTFRRPGSAARERIRLTVTAKDGSAYYVQCLAPVATWDFTVDTCEAVTDSFRFLSS